MNERTVEHNKDWLQAMTDAPFAKLCRLETVSITESEAVVMMRPEGVSNALGTVHGGAIFSLADQAFALAANANGDKQVAMSASITYLRPAKGTLLATARKIGETKSNSVYQVLVHEGGDLIAIFQGNGFKLKDRAVQPNVK